MKNWVMNWLSEKTTWAGFFAVGAAAGFPMPPDMQSALAMLAVSFFAMPDAKR